MVQNLLNRVAVERVYTVWFETHLQEGVVAMSRQAQLLWMRDLLEHAIECHSQWNEGTGSDRFLADVISRDLDCIRQVCQSWSENLAD